eukprot:CFRG3920T1
MTSRWSHTTRLIAGTARWNVTGQILVGKCVRPAIGAGVTMIMRDVSSFRDRKRKMKQMMKKDEEMRNAAIAKQSPEVRNDAIELMQKTYKKLSVGQVVDPYVPPEGSIKRPIYSSDGLLQRWHRVKQLFTTTLGVGIIKKNLPGFKPMEFALHAEQVLIALNTAVVNQDKSSLGLMTTGDVYRKLTMGVFSRNHSRKLSWSVVEQLERPRLVNVRVLQLEANGNYWGQCTVRTVNKVTFSNIPEFSNVFSKTNVTLDKKSGTTTADVIDFVVFERNLMDEKSVWRVAGKIMSGGKPL